MRCGRRLIRRGLGTVHEHSGSIHCQLVGQETCGICKTAAILQCAEPGCAIKAHPICMIGCSCCERLFCPEHAGADLLCNRCANDPMSAYGDPEGQL